MSGVNTTNWEHADWRTKASVAERLKSARLHDAEVRRASLEVGNGNGRYSRLAPNYLKELSAEIDKLEAAAATAAANSNCGNQPYRGPMNLRPRF